MNFEIPSIVTVGESGERAEASHASGPGCRGNSDLEPLTRVATCCDSWICSA